MPFYPGPCLGGHCIPIYLTWRGRQLKVPTRFIERAGEINTNMPYRVIDRLREILEPLVPELPLTREYGQFKARRGLQMYGATNLQ